MKATRVSELAGTAGDAWCYHLDEPFEGADHLAVTVINWPKWGLVETQVLPCDETGAAITGLDRTLAAVITIPPDGDVPVTHEAALASIGYETDGG